MLPKQPEKLTQKLSLPQNRCYREGGGNYGAIRYEFLYRKPKNKVL